MGTDIHAAIEFRGPDGNWHAILHKNPWYTTRTQPKALLVGAPDPSPIVFDPAGYEEDGAEKEFTAQLNLNRNYDVFAILANVRNGHGFAGVPTGSGFVPISDRRGLPDDISDAGEAACNGDHSDTWVGLQEILDYDWNAKVVQCGIVNATQFEQWDRCRRGEPASYCGGRSGPGIRDIGLAEMEAHVKSKMDNWRSHGSWQAAADQLDDKLQTRVEWTRTCAQEAVMIWTGILPFMLPLGREFGNDNVRLVMNFDS